MKPILSTIPAFDAPNQAQQVYFYWQGNPCIGAKITVTNPLTDDPIWESGMLAVTQRYNRYMCIIPSGAISENIQRDSEFRNYACVVQAYYKDTDRQDQEYTAISSPSDSQPLYAYAQPTFQWNHDYIFAGKSIKNSSVNVGVEYSQIAGEQLSYFIIHLYNDDQIEITNSGKLYNADDVYKFTGLIGNEDYWFSADGLTEFDREIHIGMTKVICRYDAPQSSISVKAENLRCEGLNKVSVFMNANLYAFDHGTEYDDGRFVDGTWIDLTDENEDGVPGNGLTYMNSTGLDSDNSIGLVVRDPIPNSLIARITDDDGNDVCELWYHEIEQNFWDSMSRYNMVKPDTSMLENPFYHVFSDQEKEKIPNPLITKDYDPPQKTNFESSTERDNYWEDKSEVEQSDRKYYPVPTYEHTTRIIAWFSLHYGENDVYDPFTVIYDDNEQEVGKMLGIDITDDETQGTRIEPTTWKVVIRSNENYSTLDVEVM